MASSIRAACAFVPLALAIVSVPTPCSAGGHVTIVHGYDADHEGGAPRYGLTLGRDGLLYGTTDDGNLNGGALFRMGTDGALTVLHEFQVYTDGEIPSGVVEAVDGNFYGTTQDGGWDDCDTAGGGTVFRWSPATGATTVLHCFTGSDGIISPSSGLMQASDGNLYGVATNDHRLDPGAVYRISPDGQFTAMHRFSGVDGSQPHGELVQGRDGFLYGTTSAGGEGGKGVVYRLSLKGKFSVLHSFAADGHEGADPRAGLIQASDGTFYGTTRQGGITTDACAGVGCGGVFAIDKKGNFRVLHLFDDPETGAPEAPLMQAPSGKFYGTTASTVFRMTAAGVVTTVGQVKQPLFGGLTLGPDGRLYGNESQGPDPRFGNWGAVYALPAR
jgi:uncharacterized repeat protein (TIGR03803 family)